MKAILVIAGMMLNTSAMAQEVVSYFGELTQGCPAMRGNPLRIDIKGDQANAVLTNANGDTSRFQGKVQGSRVILIRQTSRGNSNRIMGTFEGDNIRVSLESGTTGRCNYNALPKRKQPPVAD